MAEDITVSISAHIDCKEAIAKLRKQFAELSDKDFNRRLAAVLNEVKRKSNTQLARDIRETYPNIKLGTIKKAQTGTNASAGNLRVVLTTKGRPIPISNLRAIQSKKGVSFTLKGSRIMIKRAFIANVKRKVTNEDGEESEISQKLVFARGKYTKPGNSGFMFQKGGRKPIDVIRSVSVPGAQMNKNVSEVYMTNLTKALEDRAYHVIKNAVFKTV